MVNERLCPTDCRHITVLQLIIGTEDNGWYPCQICSDCRPLKMTADE